MQRACRRTLMTINRHYAGEWPLGPANRLQTGLFGDASVPFVAIGAIMIWIGETGIMALIAPSPAVHNRVLCTC